MSTRTTYLSKLLGIYFVLIAVALGSRGQDYLVSVQSITHNPPLVFILGVIVLSAGIALVLAHNIWSGGVLPIAVTVIGWLTLIKGFIFLALPSRALNDFYDGLQYERFFYFYMAIILVLGIGLTCGGFWAGQKRESSLRLA